MDIKALILFIDVIVIHLGFVISFWIRFHHRDFACLMLVRNFVVIPILVSIYILSMIISGIYKNKLNSEILLFKKIFKGLIIGALVGMSFLYVFRAKGGGFPSSIFLISFPIIFIVLLIAKWVIYQIFTGILK